MSKMKKPAVSKTSGDPAVSVDPGVSVEPGTSAGLGSGASVISASKRSKKKKRGTVLRILKTVCRYYPGMTAFTVICIIINAVVMATPSLYMQRVIALVEEVYRDKNWDAVSGRIFTTVLILAAFYVASILSSLVYHQLVAVITQGTLKKLRCEMFERMESLPLSFFDTNNHGDIMSRYTNDIDTLRQLISESIPQIMISALIVSTLLGIMLWFSFWLTLVVAAGAAAMVFVTRKLGGLSAKHFVGQQKKIGKEEGFIEEMMHGQKVVKVFCHEEEAKKDFDRVNEELYRETEKANSYGNVLAPILNNIGNVLYVILAFASGVFLVTGAKNASFSGLAFSISVVVPFLNMAKQFAGNINQVSHQITSVVMGIAGADRIFDLMDSEPEKDGGYVTLVNAKYDEEGSLVETEEHTGIWAWKHPHSADGSITYTPLEGDVRLFDVDFEYVPGKRVLHNISLYAKPGQKVAFVGSTGAGKTTVTNLLNRFYDIADGKIRYDGININKIKKSDLRRSLGMVLQDTNLFTGTVMDNIRYGRLDATDEECINAAKLTGADDFIKRLPEGYMTEIKGGGASLSQGQRQLISIARAAVADPPVMILDEATSSIDTRTEAVVQRGMDALMKGRTVFVIAHRLSTVKNSNVIIVLENGEIIERGSHEELLAEKGRYYSLYTGAFELE